VLALSDRIAPCPCCGLVLDRDLNASLKMLRLGQPSLASAEKPLDSSRGVVTRIRRDEAYLRYRRGNRMRTRFDEETEQDLRVLALAACYLEEDGLHLPAERTTP
jgi:hypothetical protein